MSSRRTFLSASAALAAAPLLSRAQDAAAAPAATFPLPPNPEQGILFSPKFGMVKGKDLEERLTICKEAGYDGIDFDDAGPYTPEQVRAAAAKVGLFVHGAINHAHWSQTLTSADEKKRAQGLANLKHCLRVSHAAGGSSVLLVIGTGNDGPMEEIVPRCRAEIQKAIPLAAALGQRILFENVWNKMFYKENGPRDQSPAEWIAFIDSFNSPWVGIHWDIGNQARYADVAAWTRALGPRIGKLDMKGYHNGRAAEKNDAWKGFSEISEGDIDWAAVRAALKDIGFTGWASAEVGGGDLNRLKKVLDQMKTALLG